MKSLFAFFATAILTSLCIACGPVDTTDTENDVTPDEQMWNDMIDARKLQRTNLVNKNRCEQFFACEEHISKLHGQLGTPDGERGDFDSDGDCWTTPERSVACGDQCEDARVALMESREEMHLNSNACSK